MIRTVDSAVSEFYAKHGPCCAGCDHWRYYNSVAGECINTVPVSGQARVDMLGMERVSMHIPSGHIMTQREHLCGEFIDTPSLATPPGDG